MRMWNIEPELMCTKHLLGEHVEMHMFVGTINKGKHIDGYVRKGLVEVHNIIKRHDELANEMLKRNFKHNSIIKLEDIKALKEFDEAGLIVKFGKVDPVRSLLTLITRCTACKEIVQSNYPNLIYHVLMYNYPNGFTIEDQKTKGQTVLLPIDYFEKECTDVK